MANEEMRNVDVNEVDQDGNNGLFLATLRGASLRELEEFVEAGTDFRTTNTDGDSILHVASKAGNLEAVRYFLWKGVPVDGRNLMGSTPLIKAGLAEHNFRAIIDLLVENGADLHAIDEPGNNVLLIAALGGRSSEDLRTLVSRGLSWRQPNKHGHSVLHLAAMGENLEAMRFLISEGTDVNAMDLQQFTPLMRAFTAKQNFLSIVDLLLDHGAEINEVDEHGRNIVFLATCVEQPVEDLEGLISRNADWEAIDDKGQITLHAAAEIGYWEAVSFFISKGADVNAKTVGGATPLMMAAYAKPHFGKVVKILIENRADLEAVDGTGITAFGYAILEGKCGVDLDVFFGGRFGGPKLDTSTKTGSSLAHLAVRGRNLEALRFLQSRGADLDMRDSKGARPLMMAVGRKEMCSEIVEFLIENGADVSATADNGCGVVGIGIVEGRNVIELEMLLSKGASLSDTATNGDSVLHLAVMTGNPAMLKYFIPKFSGNVDMRNEKGMTPLMLMAASLKLPLKESEAIELVDLFLEAGADINAVDEIGGTVLGIFAVRGFSTDSLKALVDRGADWEIKDSLNTSFLHWAAHGGNLEGIKYFISKGLDVNGRSTTGSTPLLHAAAAKKNFMEIVDALIKSGADINEQDDRGNDLVHFAAIHGKSPTELEQLVERGASMETIDPYGRCVAHHAADGGNLDLLRYLIANGTNIHVRDRLGKTPLLHAVRFGTNDLIKTLDVLVEAGANVNAVGDDWNNAVLLALDAERTTAEVKKLIEMGCYWWAPNKKGETVFHKLTQNGNFELFSYFSSIRTEETDQFIF